MYEFEFFILGIILVLTVQDHFKNKKMRKEIMELKKKIEDSIEKHNQEYK